MERRKFIATTMMAGVSTSFAGCSENDSVPEETDGTDDPEESGTSDNGSEDTDGEEPEIEVTLSVETNDVIEIAETKATLTGEVVEVDGADSAEGYFEWRQNDGEWSDTDPESVEAGSEFSTELMDIDDATEYEFRAVVQEADETDKGESKQFETDELIDISFSDDWENGNFTDPLWEGTEHYDTGYIEVVDESTPDGGSHALSSYSDGGLSIASEKEFRWDAAWAFETLFKVPDELGDRMYWRYNLCGDDQLTVNLGFHDRGLGATEGQLSPNLSGELLDNSGGNIDVDWEEGEWYHAKCHHDGEGVYSLKVWQSDEAEPSSYQITGTGATPSSEESPINMDPHVAWTDMRVNVAYISYETK
ncbi:hypothetical protein [Halostagnicola sp. A-GB9-2]|uniref:hypothetical protein n=1 Tax=Halostagnicola sp. A-GB9-2 TaxID=3048066 RepID=UPI0024BF1557|nr:hypothetical protein [Halostagnicola sp. A-GB9-2]MDJ1434272.1 hypothetical protein [Halostagnicola sp. A-GB9-2]